jgi:sporulation protein YlmC with PRC-barrel domain
MKVRLTTIARMLLAAGSVSLAMSAAAAQDNAQTAQQRPQGNGAQTTQQSAAQTNPAQLGEATIRQAQEALNDRGYDVGEADGQWGPRTQDALRKFQQSQGLKATGQLDPQTAAALGLTEGAVTAAAGGGAARASELMGMEVRNAQGENLGEIDDLAIDLNGGRVHYALLSFGGRMGLGDKQFAYPIRTLKMASDGEHLLLNLPRERLEKAPGFERNNAPNWRTDTRYREDVDRYFGDVVKVEPRPNMQLRWASDVVKTDVRDRSGNDIGEIEDVVVDMNNGNVQFVVVAFDQGWFERDRLATLPMRALQVGADDDNDLVIRLDQEQVATAPGFDRSKWPDLNDRNFRADADRWFVGLGQDDETADRDRDAADRSRNQ